MSTRSQAQQKHVALFQADLIYTVCLNKNKMEYLILPFGRSVPVQAEKVSTDTVHNQDSRTEASFSPQNKEFLSKLLLFLPVIPSNEDHSKLCSAYFSACYHLHKITASKYKLDIFSLNMAHLNRCNIKFLSNH